MMLLILKCIYLMLPGMIACMAPILVKGYFNRLAYPLDFNKQLRGKPLFGKNKTFRGLIFGLIFAIIFVYFQTLLYDFQIFRTLSFIQYNQVNSALLGFLFGIGVIAGDLLGSFIKRRFDFKPGQSLFPLDQLDSLIGGIAFISIVYIVTWQVLVTVIVLSLALHILLRHVGYYLGLNPKW